MSHLSTSNSEANSEACFASYRRVCRDLYRRKPLGVAFALVLLLAFEFGVARTTWIWSYVPRSEVGVIDAIETQAIAASENPQILFFGSSRIRDSVAPRIVEKRLGLHTGAVVNLGVTQGTPFDAMTLYQRNRNKLKGAKLAVFGVVPFQFNANKSINERVRRFGSVRQRLRYVDGQDRLGILVGGFWRTLDVVRAVRRYLIVNFGEKDELSRAPLPVSKDGRIIWTRHRGKKRSDQANAARQLRRFEPSDSRLRSLDDLIVMLQADGIEVVLVQVPARRKFWDSVHKNYGEEIRKYYSMVHDVARSRGVVFRSWEAAEKLGYQSDDFFDYGHMKTSGAKKFASQLHKSFEDKHRAALDAAREKSGD